MPTNDIIINLMAKATQFDAELRKAQAATKGLESTVAGMQRQLGRTNAATTQASNSLRGLGAASGSLKAELAGLVGDYLKFQTVLRGTQFIMQAGMQTETQQRAWKAIAGSTKQANDELMFLRTTANRVGGSFTALEQGYRQVAAAAKGTSLEGEAMRKVFLAITEAGQHLGLSSENLKGALLAVSQMASTGTVQLDELRQQLGSHLPGVMSLSAKAMGMTTAEFRKQIEAGNILAEEFLPRLARTIRSQFIPSMDTAGQSALTTGQEFSRLGNVLTELSARFAKDSGLLTWATNIAQKIADIGVEALKSRDRLEQMAEREAGSQITQATLGKSLDETSLKKSSDELQRLNRQIAQTEAQLDHLKANAAQGWAADLGPLTQILAEMKAERDKFLQVLKDTPKPAITLNPAGLESPDMSGFTEHANRLVRMQQDWEALNREVAKYRQSLEGVEAPDDIPRMVRQRLESDLQKFKQKYPTFVMPGEAAPQTVQAPAVRPLLTPPSGFIRRAPESMQTLFRQAGQRYNIDPRVLESIARVESNFNPVIEGPVTRSGERAQGLMQLMPKTGRAMGVTDPFDMAQNIEGGAKYLAQLLQQFKGDMQLALAAYNAGPGNAQKYGGIPPFKQTQDYVPNVLQGAAKIGSPTALVQRGMGGERTIPQPATVVQSLPGAITIESLKEEEAINARRNAITDITLTAEKQRQDSIERLTERLDTQLTSTDSLYRATELLRASEAAAAGDTTTMAEALKNVDDNLKLGTVSLNERERALAANQIAMLTALGTDEDVAQQTMAVADAQLASAKAMEEHKTQAEALTLIHRSLLDVEETLLRVDEGRADAITDIILSMKEGMPTIEDYEAAMRKLQGLGAGEGAIRQAEELRTKSTDTYKAIEQGAANLSSSLEDSLIASLTRGGDAWKEFGRIAVEELLRVLLNATQFRQTLTGLLTQAGNALVKVVSSLGGGQVAGAGGEMGNFNVDTDLFPKQHGGRLMAHQQGLVGETGQELMLAGNQMRLVGTTGPEVIRLKTNAFIIPHRETMTLLRQGRSHGINIPSLQTQRRTRESSVMSMARREAGGTALGGVNYLTGEAGVESVVGMGQGGIRSGGHGKQSNINITMHVHGAKDPQAFNRSASEVKRNLAKAMQDAQRSL